VGGGHLGVGVGGELVGEDDVGGEDELDALGGRLLLELLGELDLVSLDQGAAGRAASASRAASPGKAARIDGERQQQPEQASRVRCGRSGGGSVAGLPHLPTLRPRAARKVKTMPPPMTSLSHLPRRDSITPILDETCGRGAGVSWRAAACHRSSRACVRTGGDARREVHERGSDGTLEPPTMAAKGRLGLLTAPSR
jgi:hypothetical protein